MNTAINRFAIVSLMASALSVWAQDGPRGHWSGSVEIPGHSLAMEVDLDRLASDWIGSISIPAQNASGIPLDAISFTNGKCTFRLKGVPGDPTFTGTLSSDGMTIVGEFKQGPGTFPFKFSRAGAPKVEVEKRSPALAKEFLGTWEGTLQAGQALRLVLKISNDEGSAKAVLVSPDQGDDEIPVTAIDQKDFKLTLSVKIIGGRYEAAINKEGTELNGTWTQGGDELPLKLKKLSSKGAEQLRVPIAEIDAMVAAAFGKHATGSVTVGVVSGRELIWSKSYGYADMEKQTLATKDTVYRIGSVTKMFTALMLAQLTDAGKVHLSDPVEKYFPEVKKIPRRFADAPPITLVQLSTHTAGLSREPDDLPTYLKGPVSEWENVLIAALPHTSYEFEPGTRESYSNIGYAVLGAALSHAAGQPYVEYVRNRIFGPLSMSHSAFETNPEMLPNLSKGYDVENDKVDSETPQREHAGRGYKVPNGAIYTTVGDLARFASFLLGQGPDTVLKSATLELSLRQQPVQANIDLSSGYGRAFELIRREHFVAFGHSGGVAGYQAALYMNRSTGVAVVFLANVIGTLNTTDLALRSLDILSK